MECIGQLLQFGLTLLTIGQVALEPLRRHFVQRIQQIVNVVILKLDFAHWAIRGLSFLLSLPRPSWILVLTVPRGVSSCCAIWLWLSPEK